MRTPPTDLAESDVLAVVRAGWAPAAATATYLPVGFGSHHWAVTGPDGDRWFVSADEVREPGAHETLVAAFAVAAAARSCGVDGAHGPVPAANGDLVVVVGRWAVSVQSWLDGAVGRFGDRWSGHDASALVRLLGGLHGTPPRGAPVEDPRVLGRQALESALTATAAGRGLGSGPLAGAVDALLARFGPAVRDAFRDLDASGPPDPERLVVTHGEPHPGNVVRAASGPVLVDWDTARLAEPERDLWLVAARTSVDVVGLYGRLTGRSVDPARMRARGLRWALVDVASFVPSLLAATVEDDDTAWQLEALTGVLESL
ncbi:aminoglycoside phosphotransferase family protein [uncultured Phycicoccus sp.]|uniref:aminoglycoside phosphotransferase family protein n=1 Tax=uncultured Phycicoccus sp. TaxID=661422 RepID=UPI002632AFB9|nr:aminoglycoside phosphotransferase family protein [uncultured Phycicoccus sp.]